MRIGPGRTAAAPHPAALPGADRARTGQRGRAPALAQPRAAAAAGRGPDPRTPGPAAARPVDVGAASGVGQVLEPTRGGGYPLRRMLDTVSAHGGAELRVTVGGRTAVIARVSAPAPAADAWLPG